MMMNRWLVVVLCGVLIGLVSTPAGAVRTGDLTVVIPVAMHGPGAGGTLWQTDVWLSNPWGDEKTVTLTYYPADGGAVQSFTVSMAIYTVVEISDIVLTKFGLSDSKGLLMITTESASGVMAHARIYNTGNEAGEFGQFVPGFGQKHICRQAYLPGLSGVDGNRTNIGIANPLEHQSSANIGIKGGSNTALGGAAVTVPAKSTLQINDIFTHFDIAPQANVRVNINTSTGGIYNDEIYGYASVVRAGTGDAIFVFGTCPNS